VNDRELYERGIATALATWEIYAAGAERASLRRGTGHHAAVFPSGPEREFLNNTVLDPGLGTAELAVVLDEVEDRYAGVEKYAVWVTDDETRAATFLEDRGYVFDTSTAAMAVELTGPVAVPAYDAGPTDWSAYVEFEHGLLAGVDPGAFLVVTALVDGQVVSAALGFENEGDLGVFNVGTLEPARRRGLATALTASLVNAAVERGCTTATLQATPMAERVYEACGFRTVARILEYVPGTG